MSDIDYRIAHLKCPRVHHVINIHTVPLITALLSQSMVTKNKHLSNYLSLVYVSRYLVFELQAVRFETVYLLNKIGARKFTSLPRDIKYTGSFILFSKDSRFFS